MTNVLNSMLEGMHSLTDKVFGSTSNNPVSERKRRISLMHGFFGEAEKNRQKMLVQVQEAKVTEQSAFFFLFSDLFFSLVFLTVIVPSPPLPPR